jgi:phosphoglycerol transferase MdoB-like AlkP superfamily enzyme
MLKSFHCCKNFFWLLWPALLCRALLLRGQNIGIVDAYGFLEDAVMTLPFFLLLLLLNSRWQRLGFSLLVILFSVLHIANFEHIKANFALLDMRFFGLISDGTFLSGSVYGAFNLKLFTGAFLLPLIGAQLWFRAISPPRWLPLLALLATSAAAYARIFAPLQSELPTWRQKNVLSGNIFSIIKEFTPEKQETRSYSHDYPPSFAAMNHSDLGGKPRWNIDRTKIKNILLVTIEALYQGIVDGQHRTNTGEFIMPYLHSLAQKHLSYRNIIGHQRQTIRGQYALLCADLPNLIHTRTKASIYSRTPATQRKSCLPELLAQNGFHTVYAQAAPITFMNKDSFLKTAGFERIIDAKWFGKSLRHSGWGIDDATFFAGVNSLIAELNAQAKPWFLTLMTVGSHHPYLVPGAYVGKTGAGEMQDAFAFLDGVLEKFLHQLQQQKILDHTLVVITGDEAGGFSHSDNMVAIMSNQHAPLIVLGPEIPAAQIDEHFAQMDLGLSLLDLLALDTVQPNLPGRSIFRHYPESRAMAFANIYQNRAFLAWDNSHFSSCDLQLAHCEDYRGPLFTGPYERSETPAEAKNLMTAFIHNSDWDYDLPVAGIYRLLQEDKITLRSKAERQTLFQSGELTTDGAYWLTMDFKFRVKSGSFRFEHSIVSNATGLFLRKFEPLELHASEVVTYRYRYPLFQPITRLEVRTYAWNESGSESYLEIESATMELTKMPFSLVHKPHYDIHVDTDPIAQLSISSKNR